MRKLWPERTDRHSVALFILGWVITRYLFYFMPYWNIVIFCFCFCYRNNFIILHFPYRFMFSTYPYFKKVVAGNGKLLVLITEFVVAFILIGYCYCLEMRMRWISIFVMFHYPTIFKFIFYLPVVPYDFSDFQLRKEKTPLIWTWKDMLNTTDSNQMKCGKITLCTCH